MRRRSEPQNQSREFLATWQLKLFCPNLDLAKFGRWIVENDALFDSESKNRSETMNGVIEVFSRRLQVNAA
jgi:hypothetical protein